MLASCITDEVARNAEAAAATTRDQLKEVSTSVEGATKTAAETVSGRWRATPTRSSPREIDASQPAMAPPAREYGGLGGRKESFPDFQLLACHRHFFWQSTHKTEENCSKYKTQDADSSQLRCRHRPGVSHRA